MFRVAICDDNEHQRILFKQMLVTLSVKANVEFDIRLFSSGEELLAYYVKNDAIFHILLLDVEMSGMNGIDTAKQIRALHKLDEQIIFISGYPQYMVDSFDVMTFQYLIKPVEPSIFEEKVMKLCTYLRDQEKRYLVVKSNYEEWLLKHKDIIAIESIKSLTMKNKLRFIMQHKMIESKGLISTYAQSLLSSDFLQIHRSYIINLEHVIKFSSSTVFMSNGMELPIGRSKIKEVKDYYTKYMVMRDTDHDSI